MTLLSPEMPVVFSAPIAELLSPEEAMILQQLHYWLEKLSGKIEEGIKWIWAPIVSTNPDAISWKKRFPFWGRRRIKSTLEKLESAGYIKCEKKARGTCYHSYFYTLNAEKVAELNAQVASASSEGKNAKTLKNKEQNRFAHSDRIDLHVAIESLQRSSLLKKNSSNQDPPLPPQGFRERQPNGEEGEEFKIQNSEFKTEEPASNSTTPSQQEPEAMQQPENQGFDNFSGHSTQTEKPKPKFDKYFCERSVKSYKQGRAEKYISYPEQTELTPEEFNEFEKECLTWGMMHPETVTSPTGWLQDRLTRFTVNKCRFSHLEHWRQHRTLKNFLDKIPAEWEETYLNEYGWLKIRVDEAFEGWLIYGQKQTGMTDQQAIEKVRWQLKDYQGASMLWRQFKQHTQSVERRVEEQQKLGASGLGEIPSYFEERKEISLEQHVSTKQKLSQASSQLAAIATLPDHRIAPASVPQNQPQLPETTMQQELTPEQREELKRLEEEKLEDEWVEQNPELAQENLSRMERMKAEAQERSRIQIKSNVPAPVPTYDQLQTLWATGSKVTREQVIRFVMGSEDIEFVHNETGHIIGIKEIDF